MEKSFAIKSKENPPPGALVIEAFLGKGSGAWSRARVGGCPVCLAFCPARVPCPRMQWGGRAFFSPCCAACGLCSQAPSPAVPAPFRGLGSAPRPRGTGPPVCRGRGAGAEPPVRPEASGAAVAGPEPRRLACLALAPAAILRPFGSPLGGTFPEPKPVGWKAQTPRLVFMCELCFFSAAPIFCKFLKEFCCSLPAKKIQAARALSPPHLALAMSPVLPPQRGIGGAGLGDIRRGNFYNCRKR